MTTVINHIHVVLKMKNEEGRRGGGKIDPEEEDILPSSIGRSVGGEHGLRSTIAAAVISIFGDGVLVEPLV